MRLSSRGNTETIGMSGKDLPSFIKTMNDGQKTSFMKKIREQYTNVTEKKANVTFYMPELDDYITQEMYMPDITFTIYFADKNVIKYNPFRMAFISY